MIKKIITCTLLMCALPALAADFLKNYDGDTLTVKEGQNIVKLRLHEVDAPELKQSFGREAKQATKALCAGANVEWHVVGKSWDRIVAKVQCNGVDVGEHLISNGLAFVDERYASYSSPYFKLQDAARNKGLGVWSGEYYKPKECRKDKNMCGAKNEN
jgi:endonuclease YncB( thermonuclease family)